MPFGQNSVCAAIEVMLMPNVAYHVTQCGVDRRRTACPASNSAKAAFASGLDADRGRRPHKCVLEGNPGLLDQAVCTRPFGRLLTPDGVARARCSTTSSTRWVHRRTGKEGC